MKTHASALLHEHDSFACILKTMLQKYLVTSKQFLHILIIPIYKNWANVKVLILFEKWYVIFNTFVQQVGSQSILNDCSVEQTDDTLIWTVRTQSMKNIDN